MVGYICYILPNTVPQPNFTKSIIFQVSHNWESNPGPYAHRAPFCENFLLPVPGKIPAYISKFTSRVLPLDHRNTPAFPFSLFSSIQLHIVLQISIGYLKNPVSCYKLILSHNITLQTKLHLPASTRFNVSTCLNTEFLKS